MNLKEYKPKDNYSNALELDDEIVLLENNQPDKRTKDWERKIKLFIFKI